MYSRTVQRGVRNSRGNEPSLFELLKFYCIFTMPSWKQFILGLIIDTVPGAEVIKLFPCSTQLSMNFFLLINVKMPTI